MHTNCFWYLEYGQVGRLVLGLGVSEEGLNDVVKRPQPLLELILLHMACVECASWYLLLLVFGSLLLLDLILLRMACVASRYLLLLVFGLLPLLLVMLLLCVLAFWFRSSLLLLRVLVLYEAHASW